MTDPSLSPPVSPQECDGARFKLRRLVYGVIIAASAGYVSSHLSTVKPHLSANDRSRWCTVWSLVERGTYQIDEITAKRGWHTIDKVSHNEHFYSSKPALLPTLVAGVYGGVKQITGWNFLDDTARVERLILLVINVVPFIAALVVIAMLVERYAQTNFARYYLLLAAGFATFLTTFSVTLNNHTVAAFSVVFAIYPAMRILADGQRRPRYFLLSGFFSALACSNELPAAAFGVAMFSVLFHKASKSTLKYFVPAALIPLVSFFVTTYLAGGTWKPFYLAFGTEKYEQFHDGSKSYWADPQGIDKGTDTWPVYLLHCTIGHHGILSLSPIFLLTVLAWVRGRRRPSFALSTFLWMGLGLSLVILSFYLSRTANYNYGGHTAGLRWMFWLIPFWLLAMIPVLDDFGRRRGFQAAAVILLVISACSAAYAFDKPWQHPWLFQWMEQWNWIDYG